MACRCSGSGSSRKANDNNAAANSFSGSNARSFGGANGSRTDFWPDFASLPRAAASSSANSSDNRAPKRKNCRR